MKRDAKIDWQTLFHSLKNTLLQGVSSDLNVSRTLVAALLMGATIAGFVQGLSTQTASGVITTTATITSTYYQTWTSVTTSTQFTTTYARVLTQETVGFTTVITSGTVRCNVQDGPYLKIEISFWYHYYSGAEVPVHYYADGTITNLMNVPLDKVSIVLLFTNKDGTLSEETTLNFFVISAKMSKVFQEAIIPLTKKFLLGDVYYRILRTVIVCKDIIGIQVPVERYTFAVTQTYTYMATYTYTGTATETYTAYTQSDLGGFLRSALGEQYFLILLFAVLVVIVLIVFVFGRDRAHAPPVAPSPITPPPEAPPVRTKHCPECGLVMPLDAKHCPKCGTEQYYYGEP